MVQNARGRISDSKKRAGNMKVQANTEDVSQLSSKLSKGEKEGEVRDDPEVPSCRVEGKAIRAKRNMLGTG